MKKVFLLLAIALPIVFNSCKDDKDEPLPDNHEYVDLGLPSGTLWATRNVGADKPEDIGDYFAWGETTPKTTYVVENYKWGGYDSNGEFYLSKYNDNPRYGAIDNKNELDPADDAASVHYPHGRMPSDEQIRELCSKCSWQWTQRNGVNGQLVTGPNGNTMFLPATGYYYGSNSSLKDVGSSGACWTRTINLNDAPNARCMFWGDWDDRGWECGAILRTSGLTIRAVRASKN
jgi:hypothetical protein